LPDFVNSVLFNKPEGMTIESQSRKTNTKSGMLKTTAGIHIISSSKSFLHSADNLEKMYMVAQVIKLEDCDAMCF